MQNSWNLAYVLLEQRQARLREPLLKHQTIEWITEQSVFIWEKAISEYIPLACQSLGTP